MMENLFSLGPPPDPHTDADLTVLRAGALELNASRGSQLRVVLRGFPSCSHSKHTFLLTMPIFFTVLLVIDLSK